MNRLLGFASGHHGLFDLGAARAVGVKEHQLAYALEHGEINRVHQGFYRFAAVPVIWESRVLAACWAGGGRAFASHLTAATLHELPGGGRAIVEITCPRWRRARHEQLVVHETKQWTSRDQTEVLGIPVASVALTLLQMGSSVSRAKLERALENALRRELTTLDELDDLLRRYARKGRPGICKLRNLIRARTDTTTPTESDRESLLLQAIRSRGLPEPVRQFKVTHRGREIGRVDLAYPDVRIAIEYDSDEFHTGRVATASDSRRRHQMMAAGWLPMTAVSSDLRGGGPDFCAALRAALDDRTLGALLASKTQT